MVAWAAKERGVLSVRGTSLPTPPPTHRHRPPQRGELLRRLLLASLRASFRSTRAKEMKLSAYKRRILVLSRAPALRQRSGPQTDRFYLACDGTVAGWGVRCRRNFGSRSEVLFCCRGFKWDSLALFELAMADSSFNRILILIYLCSRCFLLKSETAGRSSSPFEFVAVF